ncbi:response regulator [Glaciibacter psychrotolerans]|uniref:DNA-binding NarL/FixJ family response regulator n=1 Tax=Glaciibacter psychrotolerans TaxID=670054 RepID=A0A7Z0EBM1_9MICO|nr:response regulator transcription factor [Leifsonia psychrotolerans]NYJ18656.1 DNA-binding NarL/FixJ family response regulator [Leifsonia psychrotolerans]
MSTTVRVFLVDDHEIVRRGVADLIGAATDIEVVGEAGTVAQARTRIRATRPDVVLLDVRLPDGNGIDICRDLHSSNPRIRCLILTAYDDDDAIYAAVIAGASGYIQKDVRSSSLVDSIRRVADGHTLIDSQYRDRVVERLRSPSLGDPRLATLSTRERAVLTLVADGLTNREIGERLSLAEKTVKNYVSGVLSKLGLQHRTQAAALHWESKIATQPPKAMR